MFARVQFTAYAVPHFWRPLDSPCHLLPRSRVTDGRPPYVGIHLMSRATDLLSGCGLAAHAHSREFVAKFSLFVQPVRRQLFVRIAL